MKYRQYILYKNLNPEHYHYICFAFDGLHRATVVKTEAGFSVCVEALEEETETWLSKHSCTCDSLEALSSLVKGYFTTDYYIIDNSFDH